MIDLTEYKTRMDAIATASATLHAKVVTALARTDVDPERILALAERVVREQKAYAHDIEKIVARRAARAEKLAARKYLRSWVGVSNGRVRARAK